VCKQSIHSITEISNYLLSKIVHSYCVQMASLAHVLYYMRINGITELLETISELHVHLHPISAAKIFLSLECYIALFNCHKVLSLLSEAMRVVCNKKLFFLYVE
jgi:hypothetical protein